MRDPLFSEETLLVDGVCLHTRTAGNGAAVVCLTGGGVPVSRAHQLLARTRRVVILEVPGFGDTPALRGTLSDLVALMNRAVVSFDGERYGLMAYGLGANLAFQMALARPEPVEAIVLIAPLAIRPHSPKGDLGADLLHAYPEREAAATPPCIARGEMAEQLLAEFAGEEGEARLKMLKVPVLSLFGTNDKVAPTEVARFYRTVLRQGYIAMVYDATNAMDVERPEAVASIAADFFARRERFIVSNEPGLINP